MQSHEIRLQHHYSIPDRSAHVAYRGSGRPSFGRGSIGRFAPPRQNSSSTQIICQLCGRTGHVVLKCFKRFDVHFRIETSSNLQTYLSNISDPQDFGDNDSAWIVESGATTHITNSLGNLELNTDYTGSDSLMVGNDNTLAIYSIDISFIHLPSSRHSLLLNNILFVPEIKKPYLVYLSLPGTIMYLLNFLQLLFC